MTAALIALVIILAALLTRGPTCPWCLAHSWRMGAHIDLDHADERDL